MNTINNTNMNTDNGVNLDNFDFRHGFSKKNLSLATSLAVVVVSVLGLVALQNLSTRSTVPERKSRAADDQSCTYKFTVVEPTSTPTSTPTPTSTSTPTPTPTNTPTPTTLPSVTPTPTLPPVCENCNFQVDAFWGPVIESFTGGTRYNMTSQGGPNRLIAAETDRDGDPSGFGACTNVTIPPVMPVNVPSLPSGCQNPVGTYLMGSIDLDNITAPPGYAKAVVVNTAPLNSVCTYDVGFVSYRADWSQGFNAQNKLDYRSSLIDPQGTAAFCIRVPSDPDQAPACHDLVPCEASLYQAHYSEIVVENTNYLYGREVSVTINGVQMYPSSGYDGELNNSPSPWFKVGKRKRLIIKGVTIDGGGSAQILIKTKSSEVTLKSYRVVDLDTRTVVLESETNTKVGKTGATIK